MQISSTNSTPNPRLGLLENCSILLVDDNPTNNRLMAKSLQNDYRVIIANRGQQALELATKELPDLILLDVMMPDMDGFSVCRHLKENEVTQHIPVIFISALADETSEASGLAAGALDYLHKPFNMALLEARIRNHLMLKRRADLLEQIASVDALTGIANRRGLNEKLANEWRRNDREKLPLSLLIIDIDQFKLFNDHFGHGRGDMGLSAVATALNRYLQRAGDFVARYGGEEFVVLLPGIQKNKAAVVAEQLRNAIYELDIPHAPGSTWPRLTISAGVADSTELGVQTPEKLLTLADKRLYGAKRKNRNCIEMESGLE